jgi:hypothetical protein
LSASFLDLRINGTVSSFSEAGVQKTTSTSRLSAEACRFRSSGWRRHVYGHLWNEEQFGCRTLMIRRSESIFESTERVKIKAVSTFNGSRRAVALAISF